jgi:hypothetical protein
VSDESTPLTALALVCSLKPSPAPSSSELIAEHVFAHLRGRGVKCEALRCADVFQGLNDVGYSIPAQGSTYWNGAAMESTDYNDLDEVPEAVASATAAAARNTVHLARLLKSASFPAYQ